MGWRGGVAPELIKILNSIILHYHVPQLNSLIAYHLYENHTGAGKPGNRWEGHTEVWVRALQEAVTRLGLDDSALREINSTKA